MDGFSWLSGVVGGHISLMARLARSTAASISSDVRARGVGGGEPAVRAASQASWNSLIASRGIW